MALVIISGATSTESGHYSLPIGIENGSTLTLNYLTVGVLDADLISMSLPTLVWENIANQANFENTFSTFLTAFDQNYTYSPFDSVYHGWESSSESGGLLRMTHAAGNPSYGDYDKFSKGANTNNGIWSFSILPALDTDNNGTADWELDLTANFTAQELALPGVVSFTTEVNGFVGANSLTGLGGQYSFVPVPEPLTSALVTGALALFLVARRVFRKLPDTVKIR